MRTIRSAWRVLAGAASRSFVDDVFTLAAAIAFYTALSLAPLVVLLLYATGTLGRGMQEQFVEEVTFLVGPAAGQAIDLVVENAREERNGGGVGAAIGLLVLLLSATAVLAQLQYSMNRIWGVEAYPSSNVLNWVRRRGFSIAMLVVLAFLLVVSLAATTLIDFLLPSEGFWRWINEVASLLVFLVLFALLYRYVPDVRVGWQEAVVGAVVTAPLFAAGKLAIGRYLGVSGMASSYGAAGSLFALLIWVYYSGILVFFGAEACRAHGSHRGIEVVPRRHAEWVPGGGRQPRRP